MEGGRVKFEVSNSRMMRRNPDVSYADDLYLKLRWFVPKAKMITIWAQNRQIDLIAATMVFVFHIYFHAEIFPKAIQPTKDNRSQWYGHFNHRHNRLCVSNCLGRKKISKRPVTWTRLRLLFELGSQWRCWPCFSFGTSKASMETFSSVCHVKTSKAVIT